MGRSVLAELCALHRREYCGGLIVVEGRREHRIQIYRGLIRFVVLSGGFHPLGQLLIERGLLSPRDVRRSLEGLVRSDRLQGQLLCDMGLVSARQVEQALTEQLLQRVLRLLASTRVMVGTREAAGSPRLVGPSRPLHPYAAIWSHCQRVPQQVLERFRIRVRDRLLALRDGAPLWVTGADGAALRTALRRPGPLAEVDCSLEGLRRLFFLWETGFLSADQPTRPRRARTEQGASTSAQARRAFHRMALQLHPDRHPSASDEERAALARRFSEAAEAYRRLGR